MHFGPFSMVPQRAIEIDGAEDLCSGNSGYWQRTPYSSIPLFAMKH